uniref:Uncharacterized protein n=1 Tax=Romanomermis culicivorax TaxID=13658 RepID=A0A915KQ88_ROMCU
MVLEAYNNRSHSLNFGTFKRRSTINLILDNKPLISRGKTVHHLALAAETSRKLLLQNPRYSSHSILSYKSQLLEHSKVKSEEDQDGSHSKQTNVGGQSFWDNKVFGYVKQGYEKLRIQKLIPLGVLILYTFLGGYIIYCIEEPIEREFLSKRADYLDGLRENLAEVLWQAKDYGENPEFCVHTLVVMSRAADAPPPIPLNTR